MKCIGCNSEMRMISETNYACPVCTMQAVMSAPDGDLIQGYQYKGELGAAVGGKLDPGFCGLPGFETGKNDPFWQTACKPHDDAFNELKAGNSQDSLKVNGGFAVDAVKATGIAVGKAVWAVGALPLYLLIGTFGGFARYRYLMPKVKGDKLEKGDMY